MSKPYSQPGEKGTDTNQASEDELRAEILTEYKQVHKLAPADYTENCTNVVMSIIRTEKLKLLAEVREEAFSGGLSFELDDGQIVIEVETNLKSITTKLEAEL